MTREKDQLWERIEHELSRDERRAVFVGALTALDGPGRDRLLARLEPDTAAAVRRLLEPAPAGRTKSRRGGRSRPSKAKVREQWDEAWDDWTAAISETCFEDGAYVVQDNDWETPYLDTSALADHLESVAARLVELLPRVVADQLDDEPNPVEVFANSAEEAGLGLPEWFGEPDWYGLWGPAATTCLLRWEWLTELQSEGERRDGGPFAFLDRMRVAEARAERWRMDGAALVDFVLGLDEATQRAMLAGIEQDARGPHWDAVLDSPDSKWFALRRELAARWAPERHLALCRGRIAKDWTLAVPVLEDMVARETYDGAEGVIEEATRSFLSGGAATWSPAEQLLVDHPARRHRGGPREELPRFLAFWATIAARTGRDELAAALRIQERTYEDWERWDPVLATFAEERAAGFGELAERLFADWRRLVTQRSAYLIRDGGSPTSGSWVPLLVDAARGGAERSAAFTRALRAWLDGAGRDSGAFWLARSWLELLTADLDDGAAVEAASPTLRGCLRAASGGRSELRASRRLWLTRLGAAAVLPDVIALWRRRADLLPPDPRANHESRYDDHAAWLAAVFELNRSAYAKVLVEWRRDHRRRSNLWRAVAARGLPVA